MNVYVIVLAQMGDIYWYILDRENWDKLDDRALCEQIHEVEHLATPEDAREAFELVRDNGWLVVESAEGPSY